MNWIFLGISAITGVALSSCGGMSGESVDEPTTQDMARLEQQWGLPARKPHSRNGMGPASDYPIAPDPQPAPVEIQPAPAAPPAPIPLEPDPPRLDAGTIKKLQ